MKKLTAIICLMFALIMVLALPVGASTPYQTYTYSIDGYALHSPDAYVPYKTVTAASMGLEDPATLAKYQSDFGKIYYNWVTVKAEYDKLSAENENYGGFAPPEFSEKFSAVKKSYDKINGEYSKKLEALRVVKEPGDIEVDADENIYIVDTGNNRVIVLDRYYNVKMIISTFLNENGIEDTFNKPKGIYITPDKIVAGNVVPGKIYVCDTDNARIVTFNHQGEYLDIISQPESEMFDEGQAYRPVAIAVDNYDRLYVVCSIAYQGIIVMTEEGEFTGFIGAQKVTMSLWDQIWRRFQTEEQRALTETSISKPFNNITLTGDFIYVTTSTIEESKVLSTITSKSTDGAYAPVKMLNAAGEEIMRRNGFYPPAGEIDHKKVKASDDNEMFGASTIVDVAVGPEKTWSIIDNKRSKVFTYDFDGNLLFAFGDMGQQGQEQLGNIRSKSLAGIVYQGDKMLLLNSTDANFTVYNRTEYGDVLVQALHHQNNRQNDKAIDDWTEILKRNSNFDAAYIGIGNALYREGQYEQSLEYFKSAYDTENYSNSYKEIRKEWISKYIILIPIFVVALCIGWVKLMGWAKKVNKRVAVTKGKRTYGQEIIYVFHVMFHPFDGFWDLKHEKRGSVRAGATILAATIVAFYYQAIGQGYVVNPYDSYATIIGVALSVIVPLGLFMAANWCLTTLFDGEGSFKDIFVACTYSLAPMILILIPVTIASNFVLAEEANILGVITTFAFIWMGLLLFFGVMVTHDYTIGKNFAITLFTIVGMICIMFIAILFSTLLGKLVSFVTNIVTELQFRM